jgi:hypothetical protein
MSGQRREPGRVPGDQAARAAGAEHHQRAEGVVSRDPDDHLGAAGLRGDGRGSVFAVGQQYSVAAQKVGRLTGGKPAAVWCLAEEFVR